MDQRRVVANRRPARLLASVADQTAWSTAFFLLNAAIGLGSPRYFAQVALATSISLIAMALLRSWMVDSAVLFAGVTRSARSTAHANLIGGFAAGAIYSAWAVQSWGTLEPSALLLAVGLVFGDNARYAWITRGHLRGSLPLSFCYCIVAVACAVGSRSGWSGESITWAWAATLICVGAAGITDMVEAPEDKMRLTALRTQRRGLTLEAVYFMTAGQVGLLALSLTAAEADVAGFRLAYAVALAPAGLLIQGLATQVLRMQGAGRGERQGIVIATWWGSASASIYILNTVAVLVVISVIDIGALALAEPYMAPLCAFLAASSASNAMHTVLRYHVTPARSQMVKVAVLASDVGLQVGGVVLGGTEGLVLGLYLAAAARVVAWIVTARWCSKKVNEQHV